MMDIKKTIGSTTVHGSKGSEGRDFGTQLNVALHEVCSQAGFDVRKDADDTIQHGGEGHRREGRAEYPGPIAFLPCRHRDIEGACPTVLFFHGPRAHPSRDDGHGRSDRFLFLR